ncbi:hypothetical protein [Halorubrum sp. DTA98]|uniref:hypothetical protein n=1 Tax=Halorubrum sp. DTA98 TaxID=3402163 RepID=UPI003AB0F04F
MLSRTGESYIFHYTKSGINVYPARPVYYDGGWGGKFQKYYEISFTEFFTRFFEGFFGEPAIARSIDSPSDVGPRELYINHLIDVKIAAGDVSIDDEIFDYIGQNYMRLNRSDFPQFDL